jgi:Arc/MetJ-type ribon-helix-helix transcriptional regulator
VSVTISTKVPEELDERIERAKDEGENTSACVRRLIRAGLKTEDTDGILLTQRAFVLQTVGWVGTMFAVGAFGSFDRSFGFVGLAALAAVLLVSAVPKLVD